MIDSWVLDNQQMFIIINEISSWDWKRKRNRSNKQQEPFSSRQISTGTKRVTARQPLCVTCWTRRCPRCCRTACWPALGSAAGRRSRWCSRDNPANTTKKEPDEMWLRTWFESVFDVRVKVGDMLVCHFFIVYLSIIKCRCKVLKKTHFELCWIRNLHFLCWIHTIRLLHREQEVFSLRQEVKEDKINRKHWKTEADSF